MNELSLGGDLRQPVRFLSREKNNTLQLIVFVNMLLPELMIPLAHAMWPSRKPYKNPGAGLPHAIPALVREIIIFCQQRVIPRLGNNAAEFGPIVFLLTATTDISRVLIREPCRRR